MAVVQPNNYIATVDDYSIGKSAKKETPFLKIKFRIKDTGQNVFKDFYLTPNTIDRVIENLVGCGLLKTKRFSDLATGKSSGGIDLEKEVEITVVNEEYEKDGEVKTTSKVEWVNPVGGSGTMKGSLDKTEATSILSGLNIDAAILASRQKFNVTDAPEYERSDIPF